MTAIVLFSGGIDSTLLLSLALEAYPNCLALSFHYGQRHKVELQAAAAITTKLQIPHRVIYLDSQAFGKSSLIPNTQMLVPEARSLEEIQTQGIPTTYVPARNTLFLAYAMGQAELMNASAIYFGANATDFNCYPDCRPDYFLAIQNLMNVATKQAVEGAPPLLKTPLGSLTKKDIIAQAAARKVPLELTLSCYNPPKPAIHCGQCDACILRREAFKAAEVSDPTLYST